MTDEARQRAAHEAIRGIEQLADRSWADPLLLLFDAAAVALKVKPEEEAYYQALETMKPITDILERRVAEALRREPTP